MITSRRWIDTTAGLRGTTLVELSISVVVVGLLLTIMGSDQFIASSRRSASFEKSTSTALHTLRTFNAMTRFPVMIRVPLRVGPARSTAAGIGSLAAITMTPHPQMAFRYLSRRTMESH